MTATPILKVFNVPAAAYDDPRPAPPIGDGWFYQIKLSQPGEVAALLDAAAYRAQIGGS